MKQPDNYPGQTMVLAEIALEELIHVSSRPIEQLPPIGSSSRESDAFWVRRKLRPEGQGSSFHNLPILGLGLHYEGDQAILAIPTETYLNWVVAEHNPGGFSFVGVEGLENSDDFLTKLSRKQFPLARDRRLRITGVKDNFLEFTLGEDPHFTRELNVSLFEHDLVDHAGLAALPAEEAEKVACVSGAVLGLAANGLYGDKTLVVAMLDRVLDLLSDYATVPARPGSDTEAQFKDFLWRKIEGCQAVVNKELARSLYYYDDIGGSVAAADFNLALDQKAFDENIRRMQKLGRPRPIAVLQELGSLVVAA